MFDAFRRTFQLEGFIGFYKGLFPNLLKVVPAASITYVVYESLKSQSIVKKKKKSKLLVQIKTSSLED